MKNKLPGAVIAFVVVAALVWLYRSGTQTEWCDDVPHRFRGTWKLIEEYGSDNYGIRSIHLKADTIVLDNVLDGNEKESQSFSIRKVSIKARKESEAGMMVVFYGPVDAGTIAKRRMQINFGPKQRIVVHEIVPTGVGDDHAFYIGDFVKMR